jgi:hypothetical protein
VAVGGEIRMHDWRKVPGRKAEHRCRTCGATRTQEVGPRGGTPLVYYTPNGERHVYYPPPCEQKER